MNSLSTHSQQPLEHRTKHIDLSTPCDLTSRNRKWKGRKQLLEILNLEDDIGDWGKSGLCLCHHCDHDSGHGWCGNPLHIHIGTWKENWEMRPEEMKRNSSLLGSQKRSQLSYDSVVEYMSGTASYYSETGEKIRIPVEEGKRRGLRMTSSKPISLLDERTGEEHVFDTMYKCAEFLGVHPPAITRAIKGNRCVHKYFRPTLLEP